MVLSCCFIFIYCKVSYVYHRRGRSHRDEIVQHPQSQGAVTSQRAHHFISLWQHRKTGDYKGMKFRGCQTPPAVLQYSEAQHLVRFSCNYAKKHTAGQHTGCWCALRGQLSDSPMGWVSGDSSEIPSSKHTRF